METNSARKIYRKAVVATLQFRDLKPFRRTLKILLKNGGPASFVDFIGNPALAIAAINPSCTRRIIRDFIKYGADVNLPDQKGNTPLHRAANNYVSNVKIVEELLCQGANIEAVNYNLETPLHISTLHCNCEEQNTISTLIRHGAFIHAKDRMKNTPLHRVVKDPYDEVEQFRPMWTNILQYEKKHNCRCLLKKIRLLLSFGADISAKNILGDSPLHVALQNPFCNINVINELISNGADAKAKNCEGITALHYSVRYLYDLNIIHLLIQLEVDINGKDCHLSSPLHYATQNCNCFQSPIRVLLDKGADIHAKNCYGDSPLHTALQFRFIDQDYYPYWSHRLDKTNMNCMLCNVSILMQQGSSINDRNLKGDTPLHLAIANRLCDINVIKFLLNSGANIHLVNDAGLTPLWLAVQNIETRLDVIKELIKCRAEINISDANGNTLLHNAVASSCDTMEAVAELIKNGANVNTANISLSTPLHTAVEADNYSKKFNIIKTLLDHGAGVNVFDYALNTPLHIAAHNLFTKGNVLQLLIGYGANILAHNHANDIPLVVAVKIRANFMTYDIDSLKVLLRYTLIATFMTQCIGNIIKPYVTNHPYVVEIAAYLNECKKEILQMQNHVIDNNLSLLDLIVPKNGVFCSIESEVTDSIMNQIIEILLCNTYPVYCDLIRAVIGRKGQLIKLLKQRIHTVVNLSNQKSKKIVLDVKSIKKIAGFLSNEDILNVNMAFYLGRSSSFFN